MNIDNTAAAVACKFAEWLQENRWFSFINGKWHYTFEHGTAIGKETYNKNFTKTTLELFYKFCKEKHITINP